ncbi:MAG: glycosyltransferase [Verrucomicrobia bacterium]|nr:glycosyltransferase [Verrucomicrobiota bacterium]
MKRVLVITYYWPPVVGAGVQRVAEFCRHLPEFGYAPVALAPAAATEPADAPCPVVRVGNRFDPASWLARKPSTAAPSVTGDARSGLLEMIRLNLFIPDSRIGWRAPAVRRASELVAAERPDLIFTSAPPYTVHLVGADLKRRFGIPWVADFRDPWLECHAYNRVWRSPLALAINRRMELDVLTTADRVTCAIESQQALFAAKTGFGRDRIVTIHNGYDGAAWSGEERLAPNARFVLAHYGTVYTDGLEWAVLEAIARWVRSDPARGADFTLRMVGTIPTPVRERLRALLPAENLEISDPVPAAEVRRMLGTQQALLLLVNGGDLHRYSHPSKVFDYMVSGNPILAAGRRDHEVMDIVARHAADRSSVAERPDEVETALSALYAVWRAGRMPDRSRLCPEFDRRTLTRQLAGVFDAVLY